MNIENTFNSLVTLRESDYYNCAHIRSDLASVYIYMYSYRIQDATDLKLKVNRKHDTTTVAMLICTLSTELQISMGRIGT